MKFTLEQLTGRDRGHLADVLEPPCTLHRAAVSAFLTLRAAAAADGIDLVAFSSFRDFERQLGIWNAKFRGERPLLDRDGGELDVNTLSPAQRVEAILWWSAMPGASRHHWGTDFDVKDAAAIPPDYRLRVVPEEYREGGPMERLTRWLDRHMHAFGFFRPYTTDRGGVSPEPWHLSYAPVAQEAAAQFSVAGLRGVLESSPVEGKAELLETLDWIYSTYVANVDPAPEAALLSPRLS